MDPHDSEGAKAVRRARDRFRPDLLVGMSVESARLHVEAVGGVFRAHTADEPVTLDYRLDRVTVVIADGIVSSARVG